MKICVTGASGFIGSALIRRALRDTEHTLVAMVRQTRTKHMQRLLSDVAVNAALTSGRLTLVYGDLLGDLSGFCEGADAVVHCAAKTFVDHGIRDPEPFVMTNVVGTFKLLEDARRNKVRRFIHVSTDEGYGAILEGAYKEDARINPTNVYAACKVGADALTIAYAHTYSMHTTVTRTENNFGPFQHPQKVFPVFVGSLLRGQKMPVYGDGLHVRQWLWVDDHVDALLLLLTTSHMAGEVFHVAGNQELTNLDLAKRVVREFGHTGDPEAYIRFVPDHDIRPGHDRRYALNCDKLNKLGWAARTPLTEGISKAVKWYKENAAWLA